MTALIALVSSDVTAGKLHVAIEAVQRVGPAGPQFWCSILGTQTAGALLLVLLAHAISRWGFGNGACILVSAQIVATAITKFRSIGFVGDALGTNPILLLLLVAGWVAVMAYWMGAQWVVEAPDAENPPATAPVRLRVNAIGGLGVNFAMVMMPALGVVQLFIAEYSPTFTGLGWITDRGSGYYAVFVLLAVAAAVFWTPLVFDHRALPVALDEAQFNRQVRDATGSFMVLLPSAGAVLLFALPRLGVLWLSPLWLLPVVATSVDTAEQWRVHGSMVQREPTENEAPCDRCRQPVDVDATHCAGCGAVFSEGLQCGEHLDRPAFAYCIACDRGLCDDCDHTQHGRHLCDEHRSLDLVEGWVTVSCTDTRLRAEALAQGLLREGTPATVLSNAAAPLLGTLGVYDMRPLVPFAVHPSCGGGDVRVLVPAAWWSRVAAREERAAPPLTTP
jgi:hypothetical protein